MRFGHTGAAALLGTLIALQLLPGPAPRAAGPPREITLLTSASLDGELKPCGCKLEPKGGLSRRAWYYAEARRKHPVTLTVEAGDFARAPDEFEGAGLSAFMAATLGKLRYDAWTPGERELFYGPEGVTRLGQALGAPGISANVTDNRDRLVFQDRLIRTVGGLKVGLTGVTDPDLFTVIATATNKGRDVYRFRDPVTALKPVVADLRRQSNLVVVLAHLPASDVKRLAQEVPGIDVIVAGHNPPFQNTPDRVGDVLIVNGGNRGHYATQLTLSFDEQGALTAHTGISEPLSVELPVDAAISAEIEGFQSGVDRREAEEARERSLKGGGGEGADHFLGDEICVRCHSDVYTKWARTAHSDAFQTLVKAGRAQDRACLPCHTVGFGDPTGYRLATAGGSAADSAASFTFRNVQCESCHGRGTGHGGSKFVARPGREVCLTCHDAKNDPKRGFEKALATGVH